MRVREELAHALADLKGLASECHWPLLWASALALSIIAGITTMVLAHG